MWINKLALVVALLLLGAAQSAGAVTTLKIATVTPEGSDWMNKMRAGAKEIEVATKGRVNIKFYGGGVMGNDKKVLRKIRSGQLQGGTFTSGGLAERFPEIQIYGLPLIFRDFGEVDYVRARMDQKIVNGLADAGFISFGLAEGGFARFMSNVPVRDLKDMEGQKVWVPEGDQISYAAMERMGLSPVTLPMTDVLTGLQTGLVDIIGSSPVGALVLQWNTKVKYMTELPLSYVFATLVIDDKAFARIDNADQAIVRDVMQRIYKGFDEVSRPDNLGATRALTANGLSIVQPNTSDLPEWYERMRVLNHELAQKGLLNEKWLTEVEGLLAEYRALEKTPVAAAGSATP